MAPSLALALGFLSDDVLLAVGLVVVLAFGAAAVAVRAAFYRSLVGGDETAAAGGSNCPDCGARNPDGRTTCRHCGAPLTEGN